MSRELKQISMDEIFADQLDDEISHGELTEEIAADNDEHYRPVMDTWAELSAAEEAPVDADSDEILVAAGDSSDRLLVESEDLVDAFDDEADEDDEALPLPPPGAPALLAKAGDGSRPADDHRGVEAADVDAELERVRAAHRDELLAEEAPLRLPPLAGEVPAPVRRHPRREPGIRRRELVPEVAMDVLGGDPGLRERDRAEAPPDEGGRQALRLDVRGGGGMREIGPHRSGHSVQ